MEKALAHEVQGIDALQIPTNRYRIDFTHPKFLERILPTGIEIHYWTINDPEIAKRLRDRGASGIVSDRIDLIVAALAE
jgi:glycerophosphoryl diester phosphodiesterase